MWWELATHRGGNIQGGIAWGGIMSGVALYSIVRCGLSVVPQFLVARFCVYLTIRVFT